LFDAVFERSANPMSILSDDRVIMRANEAKAKLLGRPAQEVIGQRLEDFVAPEQRADAARSWDRARQADEKLVGEYDIVRADVGRIRVRYAAESLKTDGSGLFIHIELPELPDEEVAASEESAALSLTRRELEVARLLASGMTGPDIARKLVLSHDTVRTHVRNAMAKTRARTRAQLVAIVMSEHLI
jgi:PAS domain S-box-containing protein